MAKLSDMLTKESTSIKFNDAGKRDDCSQILISSVFENGHIHHILPEKEIIDRIVYDLLFYTSENFNQMALKSIKDMKEEKKDKENKDVDKGV